MHYENAKRKKKKETESLFKEIMAEHYLKLEIDIDIQVHEPYRFPCKFSPKMTNQTHNRTQKSKTRDFDSKKRKETHTSKPMKAVGRFLSNSLAGQEKEG